MRSFIVIIIGSFLLFAKPVLASPAYGTQLPLKKEVFLGLQHHAIKRQNLDNDLGSVQSRQNYLTLSYGLTSWFALDLKASLYSYFRHDFSAGGEMEYKDPLWGGGYGFRIKAYEAGPVKAVAGFQHYSIHPKAVTVNGEKVQGILEDWQGSALVSYDLKFFVPYAGFRYTVMDYIRFVNKERKMIKSDEGRRVGFISGVDVPLSKGVWINLEIDWQDGGAGTAGVHCRF